jgi:arsenate reductase
MNAVLFACVHNAGRSQMAAAWFNALVDPKGKPIERVREIRDAIRARVEALLAAEGWGA